MITQEHGNGKFYHFDHNGKCVYSNDPSAIGKTDIQINSIYRQNAQIINFVGIIVAVIVLISTVIFFMGIL